MIHWTINKIIPPLPILSALVINRHLRKLNVQLVELIKKNLRTFSPFPIHFLSSIPPCERIFPRPDTITHRKSENLVMESGAHGRVWGSTCKRLSRAPFVGSESSREASARGGSEGRGEQVGSRKSYPRHNYRYSIFAYLASPLRPLPLATPLSFSLATAKNVYFWHRVFLLTFERTRVS